jgi:RNA recognition motif-containing protein
MGILRVTIGGSFSFEQKDIEEFFSKFGKIENVILKQNSSRLIMDDSKPK